MKKIKASIIGATGYAGVELFRLLYNHPFVDIAGVSSVSFENMNINQIYPSLINIDNYILLNQDDIIEKADVVFAALPHGLSEDLAQKTISQNKVFIDLGADFRLQDESVYEKWYGKPYKYKDLHDLSVYGLPELNREVIKNKNLIANPGCYPTSVSLGLMPLLKMKYISKDNIICDCKSGTTGAGRGLAQNVHFPECNEAFSPYKIGNHRHVPEIEETLSYIYKDKINVTFVPHLLPVNRGILSTMYCNRQTDLSLQKIHELYKEHYKDEFFVRVLPLGETSNIRNVKLSNFCDISIHEDKHTDKIIIVSAIDNMVKGASGQAIQNMNIRFGLEENCGIDALPAAF